MDKIHTEAGSESVYQKRLEEARGWEKDGDSMRAEEGYRALIAEYPEKFGVWWGYARFYMEQQLAKEPSPPYREIELESNMLTKALEIADQSQKLFIKQRIAEYKAAWEAKCEESRQNTRNALQEFRSFKDFVKAFPAVYESSRDVAEGYYKLIPHGKKELYFEKVFRHEDGKEERLKYTYGDWNPHHYRLVNLYEDAAPFDLYLKDFDEEKIVLAYVFTECKEQKCRLLELRRVE